MMRARVAYAGAIHDATPAASLAEENLRLADGRVVAAEEQVVWLPPFRRAPAP